MTANIWGEVTDVVSTANADNTYVAQRFVATQGQVLFTLTDFVYQIATGSLLVFVNGVDQYITLDFLETSNSSVTLTTAMQAGDVVVIRGLIGSVASQTAAESAAAADISEAAAAASAAAAVAAGITAVTNINNAAAAGVVLIAAASSQLSGTSTTSLALTAGVKTLTVTPVGKSFYNGLYVRLYNDSTHYMVGTVTSYNATTGSLVVSVVTSDLTGTGTLASWTIAPYTPDPVQAALAYSFILSPTAI